MNRPGSGAGSRGPGGVAGPGRPPAVGRVRPFGLLLLLSAAACGGGSGSGSAPPTPAAGYGGIPDLSGRTVLLLPAQSVDSGLPAPDPELAFAVEERAGRIRWVLPGQLREALSRSPGVPSDPDRLSVGMFLRAEVRRVGDPLYGDLRRLGALVGADVALIPVQVRERPSPDGAAGVVEISAALLDIRSGRVFWYGVVEGEAGPPGMPVSLATAAAALVRRVSP